MSRLVVLTLILAGCGTRLPPDPRPRVKGNDAPEPPSQVKANDAPEADRRAVAAGGADFAFDLYRRLDAGGNLVFSPLSVSQALGMAHAGARGDTSKAIADTARFPFGADRLHAANAGVLGSLRGVRWANSIWGREAFDKTFMTTLRDRYAAEAKQVALKGAEPAINAWVSDRTGGRIPSVMPGGTLTADTALVLVNAVYFKGRWQSEFRNHRTHDEPFRAAGGKAANVRMMHDDRRMSHAARGGAQAVELPFRDTSLAMLVLLPDADDGLKALADGLTGEKLAAWVKALAVKKVELALPKFTISGATLELKTPLSDMGMAKAFAPGADFGGVGAGELWINEVMHRAYIEVTEQGAEAAAATAGGYPKDGPPREPETVTFTADHPFLFVLRDTATGAVLFVGRFAGP